MYYAWSHNTLLVYDVISMFYVCSFKEYLKLWNLWFSYKGTLKVKATVEHENLIFPNILNLIVDQINILLVIKIKLLINMIFIQFIPSFIIIIFIIII